MMDYLSTNKAAWDKRTQLHVKSKFYDVAAFKAGRSTLNTVELEQVGDVTGKSLLHLQCHFGLDTLSWSRLGAFVTGVDLSATAIDEAKGLSQALNTNAHFIESDVCQLTKMHNEKYDVVFTSYGVLCWLPDLSVWAKVVADSLKSGGEFHLVEFHPFNDLLSGYAYFHSSEPDIEEEGTYTENCEGDTSTIVTWPHTISDVVSALLGAGLTIDSFQEHIYSPYNCFEGLEFAPDKGYFKSHNGHFVPMLFSIKATKSES